MDEKKLKAYYDDFLDHRMVNYFLYGNKRIDAAVSFVGDRMKDQGTLLDFGCGIGAVSEKLSQRLPEISVLGVDASPRNISFAEVAYGKAKVAFREHSDLSHQSLCEFVQETLGVNLVDTIIMIDVIEHIPSYARETLLSDLRSLVGGDGDLFITYPTPWYQDFLRSEEPEELQIIDESIHADQLLQEARSAGWNLREMRTINLWRENQYFHLHLKASQQVSLVAEDTRLKARLVRHFKHRVITPFRRRRLAEVLTKVPTSEMSK